MRRAPLRPGDIVGTRTILAKVGGTPKHPRYRVRCKCGAEQVMAAGGFASPTCRKCRRWGQPVKYASGVTTHHRLYKLWLGMRYRCRAVDDPRCKAWAGRGIKVCEEWDADFESFERWSLANGWEKGLSLDRLDVDKGYGPDNCEWVTRGENSKRARAKYRSVRVEPSPWTSYLPIEAMFGSV